MNRPNIIQIVTDQQHPDLIGALGRLPVKTPNLDRLCAEGTAFTRAYTPCPLCTPARASLVTGQYPSTHGAWTIGTTMAEDSLSLPNLLSKAGYRTGIIGKSHLRPALDPNSFESMPNIRDFEIFDNWSGPWYGFDEARICTGHTNEPHAYSMHYGNWLRKNGIPPEPPYFAKLEDAGNYGSYGLWELPEEYHSGAWIAEETESFIQRHGSNNSDTPFYLSINLPDPHMPFRVSERWRKLYDNVELPKPIRQKNEAADKPLLYQTTLDHSKTPTSWKNEFFIPNQMAGQQESEDWTEEELEKWRLYLGMTSLLDEHVGRILDTVDRHGLTEDTLIVFTSDHGDYMGHHWLWSKGGSHYDQAVRVPLIVRWPGHVPAGQKSDSLQSLLDLPVTFMSAAGLEPHPEMEGVDQSKCWRAPDDPVRTEVLIDHRVEEFLHVHSLITPTHRLSVHHYADGSKDEHELYELSNLTELINLAGNDLQIESDLAQQLNKLIPKRTSPWPPRTGGA